MIFFSFKNTSEPGRKCADAWRWVFQTVFNWEGRFASIGVNHQWRATDTQEWNDVHSADYYLAVMWPPQWGIDHFYYDGPHCSLNLGVFRVGWSGDPRTGWCNKCCPKETT